ncbi:TIGR02117 family protein [Hymenobacter lapidiphilus]|uniref:TIGR02117 family protein n=1 Tax=Hymenobacter sp. CCM 8763 TaxID=2303334 RepID=UPI000E34C53F|nr:TIGR02117 family protein [Hymenobacter sp. CCM 8763]RFP65874.1 TIGR02117 family protein [Hymenobacter sp. CCM 8763]
MKKSNPLYPVIAAVAYTGIGIIGLVAVYVVASVVLSAVPVAGAETKPAPGETVEVYLLSNGVHTDLVLPVRNAQKDWTRFISYADTPANDTSQDFVGFGWGDRGFYLDTPTWAELKLSTGLKAMFWLGTTAMHTTFHHRPKEGPKCVLLQLTPVEYARLVRFIETKFDLDAQGRAQQIKGHSYGQNDAFYLANGTYNLFDTCNSWTNRGLKTAGQRAALWTPFDFGMFWHY